MILNDKQILKLANDGMIQPFTPKLVRRFERGVMSYSIDQNGNEVTQRVYREPGKPCISFGASSYGFDIRLSPKDFRIFRHIPGTVINPKAFNPDNLISAELHEDEYGRFFILPGHSYGLGVALERLQMPRNITAIAIGKSTYARCFSAETKVKLVDGDFTFTEMISRVANNKKLFGFGVNSDRRIVTQELIAPRFIENSRLIRVTLNNLEQIDCTPDHIFLLKNGDRVEAQNLTAGDSLQATEVYSHKVLSVESLPGEHPTYCLTAPSTGNFALAVGVFVENCGIIANLTPIESQWQGNLTIELSNSSNADVRIYANEGICQLLFFQGEDCSTSYSDRSGKYQGQSEEVTLAKV
jgi:deoxycytidine triphosphate deaminase